uniref:Uncharacterized protein n=1 Tax=Zea mays TaxID=4577 RepID=A0A804MQD8_MAIZE
MRRRKKKHWKTDLRAVATDTAGDPGADGHGEPLELHRLEQLDNLLELLNEEHLLLAVGDGPVAQDVRDHRVGEPRLLAHELEHAVGELAVVRVRPARAVQRQQHARQEHTVLLLERNGEAVDDAAADLQKLGGAAVALGGGRLVGEPQERGGHGAPHEGALAGELGVELVVHGLEPVALAGVLGGEQRQEGGEEGAVHVVAQRPGVRRGHHGEEDVVDHLQVRPRRGQSHRRRLLVGAVGGQRRVRRRRHCAEQVGADHLHQRHHHAVVQRLPLAPARPHGAQHLHEPVPLRVPLLLALRRVDERERAVARRDLVDQAVRLGLRRRRRQLGRAGEQATVRLLELEQELERGRLPLGRRRPRCHDLCRGSAHSLALAAGGGVGAFTGEQLAGWLKSSGRGARAGEA